MHRLVIASVTLLGLTGAAFLGAYLFLFGAATDRASALVPADSAFYANVYLRPSAGQQMNLGQLIGRLPGFADEASLDDKVDQIVQNLLADTGVDYRQHIKPWLGDQVAVAGRANAEDPTQSPAVVIAEVKDRAAAETSLADLADGSAEPSTYEGVEVQPVEGGAYAFVGEMLVFGTDAESVHAVIDTSNGGPSLADDEQFVAAMAELEEDHLASAFVDVGSIAAAGDVAEQFGSLTTASAVLVAEEDGLRVSGSAPFDSAEAGASARDQFALGSEPSSLVDWMPDETLAELVVFGLRQTLEDAETAIANVPEGEELTSSLDTLRAIAAFGLGIDLDADVLPLLDREVAVALTGLEGGVPSGQLLLRPDDPAAAGEALDRIAERLTAIGATTTTDEVDGTEVTTLGLPDTGEVAYAVVDEIVILGFGSDDVTAAIEAHASGESLGASEPYRRAFEVAGARAGTEAFVDIGALVDLLGDGLDLPADARDILSSVGSVALTAPSSEDRIEFHAVVTVEEE